MPVTTVLRVGVATAALGVFTNGPILLFSKSVLDRSGRWEDLAVWPWLAAAGLAGTGLLAWELTRRRSSTTDSTATEKTATDTATKLAAAGVVWFTLAALASTLWSVDASATFWRSCVYAGMALLAAALARFESGEISVAVSLMATAAVASSLILVATRPDLGITAYDRWQGVYTNPNSLAPLAAISVLAGVRWSLTLRRWQRLGAILLVTASLATLVGAGSRTAWAALIAALVVASLVLICQSVLRRHGRTAAIWALITSVSLSSAAAVVFVAVSWNVESFSNRRGIWRLVWERILERPLAGHGFFTFWNIEELTQHVLLRLGSAHNSLLEVALGLGLLGTAPFLVIVMLAARNAGLALWRTPSSDTWMWAALIVFLLVENLTESFVLWFSYSWVLLMAAALRPAPKPADATPVNPTEPATKASTSGSVGHVGRV